MVECPLLKYNCYLPAQTNHKQLSPTNLFIYYIKYIYRFFLFYPSTYL